MELIKELEDIVNNPYDYTRQLSAGGKKIVGYMCSYAPEELIWAAGAHPLRLFGSGKNIKLAEGHLQNYCCSLVRGVLEDALAGNLPWLAGMVFPHTCDSIQRLSDIWRLNIASCFHLDVVLPVKLNAESARIYMVEVFRRLRSDLETKLQVKITDEDLRKSIALYNDIRSSLQRIYELKNNNPDIISGRDIHTLTRAAMTMDRSEYRKILRNIIGELEKSGKQPAKENKKRIVLSGGICSHPDIYSLIEDAGGVIVGDDLCTGSRYFAKTIGASGDSVAAIAERYRQRVNCPAKHIDNHSREKHLVQLVQECNARGVIFVLLKFCDPHAFDYPYLQKALGKATIAHLLLEVEDQPQALGQLKTRLEAFLETL